MKTIYWILWTIMQLVQIIMFPFAVIVSFIGKANLKLESLKQELNIKE